MLFTKLEYSHELQQLLDRIRLRLFSKKATPENYIRELKNLKRFQETKAEGKDEFLIKEPIRIITDKIFALVSQETKTVLKIENLKEKKKELLRLRQCMKAVPFNSKEERDICFLIEDEYAKNRIKIYTSKNRK